MTRYCAIDLEMNGIFPLAIGVALSSKAGKLLVIDQQGREPEWFIRKYIVTDPALWAGTLSVATAMKELLALTAPYDVVYTWGKEAGHLNKLAAASGFTDNLEFIRLVAKIVNAQSLFEQFSKLQDMYTRNGGSNPQLNWHNPLSDAIATLELATSPVFSEKRID
jgi:hypothetical protein